MANQIEIVVEAVQYTTHHEPVLIQYSGKGVTKGPLAKTSLMHTTQARLHEWAPSGTPDGYWSDDEVHAALIADLAESGITAVIAEPDIPENTGGIEVPVPPVTPVTVIPANYRTSVDGKGLGRLPALDPRDNQYKMSTTLRAAGIVESMAPKSRMWVPGSTLDQGDTPTCVAHAWAGFLAASPVRTKVPNLKPVPDYINDPFVMGLYKSAQKVDEWPGEDYEGTSVRAGAKVLKSLGRLSDYIWATDAATVRLHILARGPAVIGINWYEDMFDTTDDDKPLNVSGSIVGGHALLVLGYSNSRTAFRLLNSWGDNWGKRGRAWLNFSDMQQLLRDEYGEACSATEISPTEDKSNA